MLSASKMISIFAKILTKAQKKISHPQRVKHIMDFKTKWRGSLSFLMMSEFSFVIMKINFCCLVSDLNRPLSLFLKKLIRFACRFFFFDFFYTITSYGIIMTSLPAPSAYI